MPLWNFLCKEGQGESESLGPTAREAFLAGAAVFDHGPEDTGQFVDCGSDGGFGHEFGAQTPEPVTKTDLERNKDRAAMSF